VSDGHDERSLEEQEETRAGNQFIANYPPFSVWNAEAIPRVYEILESRAPRGTPLGIYVHLPFCRKRCDFCFFKVYTDKNSRQITLYLDAVLRELEMLASKPYFEGRQLDFVYFGGGTPSYLSTAQLERLFEGMKAILPWRSVKEVTFECEPGTLQASKLEALARLGVTRLSFGVESFDEKLLELNNRAHRREEIFRAWEAARAVGFPQINLDLIAGMVGETDEGWRTTVDETVRLAPDSVTIYQMEVPHNTTIYQHMREHGDEVAPVADWATKRRWVDHAFGELERAGYRVGSAYTVSRGQNHGFQYRDALWHGADLAGIGVSSFSHLGGVHYQNEHSFEPYVQRTLAGELPILRALAPSPRELMIREFVLQMKTGKVETRYFQEKFGVDLRREFAPVLERHRKRGWIEEVPGEIRATRAGLLRIDEILREYFLPEHQDVRYA
jgi:oxygen-independent coproporphyrinogen-3 oxidase